MAHRPRKQTVAFGKLSLRINNRCVSRNRCLRKSSTKWEVSQVLRIVFTVIEATGHTGAVLQSKKCACHSDLKHDLSGEKRRL